MKVRFRRNPSTRRRGVTAVLVLVMTSVLLGFAALTVDVGVMYNTRADLQRAADAAAMAGVSAYVSDPMMQLRLGSADSGVLAEVLSSINSRVSGVSGMNATLGTITTHVEAADIVTGQLDPASSIAPILPPATPSAYNAVQVSLRRTADGANGAVDFHFASILGMEQIEITATATAIFDDRVGGFDIGAGWLLPFTMNVNQYENDLATGGDDFGFDEAAQSVTGGADGIREVNLYPHNLAPGNFGLLNIPGSSPPSTPGVSDQIENGVEPDDLEQDIGSTELTFYDDDGSPVTYTLGGNPGMTAALESSIDSRVGQLIGFLLHDQTSGSGNNTNFHITDIRFGRLMGVQLNGPPSGKGLWIQPAVFAGSGLRINVNAPSSGGKYGRIVLAR